MSGKEMGETYSYFSHTTRPLRRSPAAREKLKVAIDEYFAELSKAGQVLLSGCITVVKEDVFETYFLSPSREALDDRYASPWVKETELQLATLCEGAPEIDVVGKSADHDEFCGCVDPKQYVVTTDQYVTDSPVTCMVCGLTVPLYRLTPYSPRGEFYDVLMWQNARAAAERLWGEGITEATMYRQMRQPNSELTKRGRQICSKLAESNDAEFFYLLFIFDEPYPRNCPSCGNAVAVDRSSKAVFRWICRRCHLVIE